MSTDIDTAKQALEDALARLENLAAEVPHVLQEFHAENQRLASFAQEISQEMGDIIHDLEAPEEETNSDAIPTRSGHNEQRFEDVDYEQGDDHHA